MSTLNLLKKLKRFLPNNTANKLLKNDLVYIENGAVVIIRYNCLYEIFGSLKERDDFPIIYKEIFDGMIASFLDVIYDNGGVFLRFDTNQISIVFDNELTEKHDNDLFLQSINCCLELNQAYAAYIEDINNKYSLSIVPHISAGVDFGDFADVIIGNDKRKERLVLGSVAKTAIRLSSEGKNNDILISSALYAKVKKEISVVRKGQNYSIKELRSQVDHVELPQDNYLNLKTSIIKSFLPAHLFADLKENINYVFNDYKEGAVIDFELSGIHDFTDEYLAKFPTLTDDSEKKVFTDNYFFGMNKLFKKIFRNTVNFDGSINKVELSRYGLRIIISFSLPKTFDNDKTNKFICIEEIAKVTKSFKKFSYKIVHFEDKMFASIIGCDERAGYIISSPFFEHLDDFVEKMEEKTVVEYNFDHPLKKAAKQVQTAKTAVKKENGNNTESNNKIELKGLFTHKVIGRNKEIIALNQYFREGGKIITLTGHFGCGKSRLVQEIIGRMKNENFQILHYKVENRDNILDLFKSIIEEKSKITLFDDKETIRQKLDLYTSELLKYGVDEEENKLFSLKLPILYKLMYNIDIKNSSYEILSPKLRLENLKEALSLYIIYNYYYYSRNSEGVIFIFDDIDNLKHEEKDLMQYLIQYAISHLVERGNRRNKKGNINKISFLITHHISENLEFNKILKPIRMELAPLKKATMKLLLKELAGQKKIPSEIEKVLLKFSEGNPFYLEQYFRFIFTNQMVVEKDNELEKTKLYKKKIIPQNIEEIVKSNLQKLKTNHLLFLQAASVIGVKFDITIVKEYYDNFTDSDLTEIIESNFIKKYNDENIYIFSHPMVSDVLYNMSDEQQKIKLHKKVAIFLEKTLELSDITHCNWLGYHYNKAGENEKATKYLKLSYYDSKNKNFIETAYNNLNQAIEFQEEGKELDELIMKKVSLLYQMNNFTEARKVIYPLLKKYEETKDYQFTWDILCKILHNTINYSPVKKLIEFTDKLTAISTKIKIDNHQKNRYYYFLGIINLRQNQLEESISNLTKSSAYAVKANDCSDNCHIQNELGKIYESQFLFKKSLKTFEEALLNAEKIRDLELQSVLLGNLGKLNYKLGRVKEAIKYYKQALEIASLLSLKEVEGKCAGQLGNVYLEIKDLTSAQLYLESSIKIFRALNNLEEISYRLSDFGECNIYKNNTIEAEKCFNKAYKIAKEINSSVARAYALQNMGRLKVMKKNYEEAEITFKEAIKIYREKKMYKRIGMIYFFLAKMHYKQIVEYENDLFIKHKEEKKKDLNNILKYMKYSLDYSKRAKNIHYIASGYLLLGKILKRKNRISEAILNLEEGMTIGKISDYSKLYINLAFELADAYQNSENLKDAMQILKTAQKAAKKHNDIKSINFLNTEITRFKNT